MRLCASAVKKFKNFPKLSSLSYRKRLYGGTDNSHLSSVTAKRREKMLMRTKILTFAAILTLSLSLPIFSHASGDMTGDSPYVNPKTGKNPQLEAAEKDWAKLEKKFLKEKTIIVNGKKVTISKEVTADDLGKDKEDEEETDDENGKKKKKGENGDPGEGEQPQVASDTPGAKDGKEKSPEEITKERKAVDAANKLKLAKGEIDQETFDKTMEANHAAWGQEDAQRTYDKAKADLDKASTPQAIANAQQKLDKAQTKLDAAVENNYNKGWGGIEANEKDAARFKEQSNDSSLSLEDRMAAANAADNHQIEAEKKKEALAADQKTWEEENAVKEAKKKAYAKNASQADKDALQAAQKALTTVTPGSGKWGDPEYGKTSTERENNREMTVSQRKADYWQTKYDISGDSSDLAKADAARTEVAKRQSIMTADKLAWDKDAAIKTISDMSSGIIPRDDTKLAEAKQTLQDSNAGAGKWADQWGYTQPTDLTLNNEDAKAARSDQARVDAEVKRANAVIADLDKKRNDPKYNWTDADQEKYDNAVEYRDYRSKQLTNNNDYTKAQALNSELYKRSKEGTLNYTATAVGNWLKWLVGPHAPWGARDLKF